MKLHLPEIFVNSVSNVEHDAEGRRVFRVKQVESRTGAIRIDYSGPLGESYSQEALKAKKVLEIHPGQTLEFTDAEAKFLMERYPFLEEVKVSIPAQKATALPPVQPLGGGAVSGNPKIDIAEAPTNFMQFKKWAEEKGVEVLPNDNKDAILKKIAAI